MPKVFVGMSGGIDSSTSAMLLKEQGYDVVGVTFQAINNSKENQLEIDAARKVCQYLGISHLVFDVRELYREKVINLMIQSYQRGLTPNPCVFCNRHIKFGAMAEYSLSKGAEYFSTGHYIRLIKIDGEILLRRGIDQAKEQSYFLSYIRPKILPHLIFPLGNYHKSQVKELAKKNRLPVNSYEHESQDICFITGDYREFLSHQNIPESPGDFVYKGKTVGRHRGIPYYSLGQRRGHGVALGKRLYIREFDLENNRIILGSKPVARRFHVRGLNSFTHRFVNGEYLVQVRYRSKIIRSNIEIHGTEANVELKQEHEIIAPGQLAAFYQDDLIYGAGIIDHVKLLEE